MRLKKDPRHLVTFMSHVGWSWAWGMVWGKPLVPVQWDIEKYLSQAETDLIQDKAGLARAKADMSREPHTKVYLLGLMSIRKS
jgi:hypothetical protein